MSGAAILAVFDGAGFGTLLRWWPGLQMNALFPTLPPGTLAAKLIGGLLAGLASAWFTHQGSLPIELRLLVFTGFLGSCGAG